jgi:hypothetical protein
MGQSESCKGCSQAHACGKVYEHLGNADGPCVAWKVVVAFLLPMAIFIGALGVCGGLLDGVVASGYETPLAAVLAAAITTAFVLVASAIARRPRRNE